ncbi:Chloroperoxidase [Ophiocordyceps sinensis CO18]|uniref:Chloroperoxidase n=1 Tax=Ophiocordyceps sinensis (strain Co18 / CGMCC 3.14243) TaxID=911162 RepID=T5AQ77_OPHSC|nr:Chloroperoxidase [Ophiocordyceps sinensis CO18]
MAKSRFQSTESTRTESRTDSRTDSRTEHEYIRGNAEDRGPCPALNALANQGYLPRDGKNMTVSQVEAALREALSMTSSLAASNTRQLKSILHADGTFNLTDLRQHGVIEHDRSFTRRDLGDGGDNYTLQADMFRALLDDAGGGPVTVKTLAKTYRRRATEHKQIARESLPLHGGGLSREVMDMFYVEERFPEEVLDNKRPRTLLGLVGNMVKLLFYIYI